MRPARGKISFLLTLIGTAPPPTAGALRAGMRDALGWRDGVACVLTVLYPPTTFRNRSSDARAGKNTVRTGSPAADVIRIWQVGLRPSGINWISFSNRRRA